MKRGRIQMFLFFVYYFVFTEVPRTMSELWPEKFPDPRTADWLMWTALAGFVLAFTGMESYYRHYRRHPLS